MYKAHKTIERPSLYKCRASRDTELVETTALRSRSLRSMRAPRLADTTTFARGKEAFARRDRDSSPVSKKALVADTAMPLTPACRHRYPGPWRP